MSSEFQPLMPRIDWHFTEPEDLPYGGHGYTLFHDLLGEEPIGSIDDFQWRGPDGIPAPVYLLSRPPDRGPKLTQAEWTVVVAEVVATICSILHEPFYPRLAGNGGYNLEKTFGRVTARGGF